MKQALHIFIKDLRHLRLQIGVLYFLALTFWVTYLGDTIAPEWSLCVNLGFLACLISVIYAATREDSVTNSSTWWATRPISPVALFIAKLMLWFTTIALPLAICALAVALRFQLTGGEIVLSVLEVTLVTAIAAGLVATITSIGSFGMGFSMLFGGIFLVLFIGTLVNIQAPRGFNATGLPAVPFRETSLTLGLIALTLASLGAWGLRIIRRVQGLSVGILITGIVLFAVSTAGAFQRLSPKFRLAPEDEARISVKLLDSPSLFRTAQQPTQLYSHFAFEGLAPNEFVALDWIDATFQFPEGGRGRIHDLAAAPGTSNHQFERSILGQLQPLLLSHFPKESTWHSEWNNRRSAMFPIAHPDPNFSISSTTIGSFEGKLQAQILKLSPVKNLPLTPGVYPLDSGRSLDLQGSEPQWDSVRVKFSLTRPRLALSKSHESGLASPYYSEDTRYVFAVYHSQLKEGYLLENLAPTRHRVVPTLIPVSKQAFQLRVPFSSLQSAINGLTMSEWMQGVELHVFKIEPVGIKAFSFSHPEYRPYHDRSYSKQAPTTLSNLTLAENASPTEVEAFIKSVISQIPERYDNESILMIRSKIESIGSEHLPILLEHLPHDDSIVNSYLLRPVTKLMKPEHLPAFKKLWAERDLFLTEIRRRKWSDQVRDVLIPRVKRRSPISPIAVAIAAESNDPGIYDDLRWHFVKSRWGHETMLRSYEKCDGLDLAPLIRTTWKRARLNIINPDGVSLAAAALGLPDSLRLARAYMEKLEGDRRIGVARKIQDMTVYSGPDESFESWLDTHFGELQFDGTIQKYKRQDG